MGKSHNRFSAVRLGERDMQYKTGSVNVTNGSQNVVGVNTKWMANIYPSRNWLFIVAGHNVVYTVVEVTSDTTLQISPAYQGDTAYNASYAIVCDFTVNYGWPTVSKGDIQWPLVVSEALARIDKDMYEVPKCKSIRFEALSSSPEPVPGRVYFDSGEGTLMLYIDEVSGWQPIMLGVYYYEGGTPPPVTGGTSGQPGGIDAESCDCASVFSSYGN
jgi:hypothetical protein